MNFQSVAHRCTQNRPWVRLINAHVSIVYILCNQYGDFSVATFLDSNVGVGFETGSMMGAHNYLMCRCIQSWVGRKVQEQVQQMAKRKAGHRVRIKETLM